MASYNYVRFVRCTPTEYSLVKKDDDTLYFVYDSTATNGLLYLGSKTIIGGLSATAGIEDLSNISVDENLTDNYVLVYDSENKKWVDKNISDVLQTLTNTITQSCLGQILHAAHQDNETDTQVLARMEDSYVIQSGDFVIIDINTANQKNYVYDGVDWCLLNSAYSTFSNFNKDIFENDTDNGISLKGYSDAEDYAIPVKSPTGELVWKKLSELQNL